MTRITAEVFGSINTSPPFTSRGDPGKLDMVIFAF
jgi:hypothetical protein